MKYQPGFVPVQFKRVGKAMIILGLLGILLGVLSYMAGNQSLGTLFLVCIGLIIIGAYLVKFVPKEPPTKE